MEARNKHVVARHDEQPRPRLSSLPAAPTAADPLLGSSPKCSLNAQNDAVAAKVGEKGLQQATVESTKLLLLRTTQEQGTGASLVDVNLDPMPEQWDGPALM